MKEPKKIVVQDHHWRLEDLCTVEMQSGWKVVDLDSVNNRLFVLMNDLTLVEVCMLKKEIVLTLSVVTVAPEMENCEGVAFAMFKDLNMMAISTSNSVCLFDYENELSHVTTIPASEVKYITFVDVYIVMLSESEDGSECTLACYQIDSEQPEASITIKQFMGA